MLEGETERERKKKRDRGRDNEIMLMGSKSAGRTDAISPTSFFLSTLDTKSLTLTQKCPRRLGFQQMLNL